MSFVVSARKYRPARFEDVVGQGHVSQTLKKALQTDHLAHAFLFTGPRGVGKTTCARILAKVLNCQNVTASFEPCGVCDSCQAFDKNASFNIMELDAASNNSVDHIRALVEQVRFQPQQGKYKVFIIDEVHMLSQSAFNAFLKTLEEPPPYAIFILATTEKHKIIPTILSRCQIFDFKRIQIKDMVAHLQNICGQEGIAAEKEALHIIAQKADGALRDALSIFDRIVSFSGKKITYEDVITNLNVLDYDYYFRFADALLTEDLPKVLLIFNEVLRNGFDGDLFINGLAEHLRNLLVCKDAETLHLLEVSDSLKERYGQQAAIAPASFLLTALNLCNDCDINYKMARNKPLHVETYLIKMCFIGRAVKLASSPQPVAAADGAEKKTADGRGADGRQPIVGSPPSAVGSQQSTVKEDRGQDKEARMAEYEKQNREAAKIADEAEAVDSEVGETEVLIESDDYEDGGTDATLIDPDFQKEIEEEMDEAEEQMEVNEPSSVFEKTPPDPAVISPKISLRKPISGSLTTFQSLDSLDAEVARAESNDHNRQAAKLTAEDLKRAWSSYIESSDKDSVRTILKGAEISIEGEQVLAVVGSALAESAIRQESSLMEFLREQMHAPRLALQIRLDPTRSNAAPAKPKKMTDSEKYWGMKTLNPLVDEVRKRFDLKLENE
ncbi:MAG: DNA polymerase III subunit gamma/tau [Lewinellaceae bacterium]|nr:DNA polymerase III subunit gamma/tau [Saprospiraceae bacterium]MCB9337945.1 DNA polymerase III subunit gamma/tau [Lewinellaceae bacterium]